MAEAWPNGVPTAIQKSSYQEIRQDGVIRTNMEVGFPKVRRRFTAITRGFTGSIIMSESQFNTFESWFENTVAFGALTFMFPHPVKADSREARFSQPYKSQQYADTTDFEVKVDMEFVP